jgi:hypothetical protein
MSLVRFTLLVVIAVVTAGLVAACDWSPGPPTTGMLVTVELRGGLCVDGPCDTVVILDQDGRVHAAAKPPNDLGVVPPAQVDMLEKLIAAADYGTIKGRPFTGECPTAFDGQEFVIDFTTTSGIQHIASCQVEIDWGHPLFVALSAALGPFIPLPTT